VSDGAAWGTIAFCPRCGSNELRRKVPRRDDRERQVCGACDYVHYVGPVLAAGLVVRDGDRVCLVRRAHDPWRGRWSFPGGFVDLDEEPAAAALREVREEAGVVATIDALVGLFRSAGPNGKPVVIAVYDGRCTGAVACARSAEVDDVCWFDARAIPWDELAFPETAAALRAVLAPTAGG
jgi:ADP-ribose pyrophosphatase